ncbi:MAG: 3-dehydroquinate synthase [Candidatus Omnitrophota bacterium]
MIRVKLNSRSYNIVVESDNLKKFAKIAKRLSLGPDAVIITNNQIRQYYGQRLTKVLMLEKFNTFFITVLDSEKSKSLDIYKSVISKITRLDKKRKLFLIAFGGGVIGDLTGFIAATYKRGIPYLQLPSTLLAQVDSAIGGKTGIDLPAGKNLVGAIYQPRVVFSDISLLKTLPRRQIISGMAEVIKYAVIFDRNLFIFLDKNAKEILNLKPDKILYIVKRCSQLKAEVVSRDEFEKKGYRTLLNLGHTIGHAIEAAGSYSSSYSHGEAIAVGLICAAEISHALGIMEKGELNRIEELILKYNLPNKIKHCSIKAIMRAQMHDKKYIHRKNRLVLPAKIGHTIVVEDISEKLIKKIIQQHRV